MANIVQKHQAGYAAYNAATDRIATHSVSAWQHIARRKMCEIYSDPDKKAVWTQLKKDGWRIVKIGMVRIR